MKRFHFVHTPPRHPVDRVVEMDHAFRVEGIIHWQLLSRGGIIMREGVQKNLITDTGLEMIAGKSNANLSALIGPSSTYCAVGTGSTAPTVSDATLDTEIPTPATNRTNSQSPYTNLGPTYVSGPPDYWWYKTAFLFGFSQSNGNLTEIGLFYNSATAGDMFMRQLLKDSGGTPTTVVKTSAEQLLVYYEFRIYPQTGDTTQTGLTISGTNYDITTRAANANGNPFFGPPWAPPAIDFRSTVSPIGFAFETQTLGARTSYPSGTDIQNNAQSISTYGAGNKYRDHMLEWGTTIANFATGIGSIAYLATSNGPEYSAWQSSFDPKFAKDSTKRLQLRVRFTLDRV